jgi:DNA-binding beta-propeller fold protein YncE
MQAELQAPCRARERAASWHDPCSGARTMPPSIERRAWLVSLLSSGLAGCAAPREAPPAPRGPWLWPAPPEQPRFIYEATLRNASSLGEPAPADAAQRMRRWLSGAQESRASFGKPFAVAAAHGRVYVTDTEGRRVFVFDLPRRRSFSFGTRFEGELRKPAGIAIDAAGQVYVVDASAKRVVVYDALGLFLLRIDGARDWVRPTAVAVDAAGERICVVDTGGVDSPQHGLWVYDARGRVLRRLVRRGAAPGEFNLPTDAAFAADGSLWVLDAGNFRVQAFDAEGRFVREFGSAGNRTGQFARPRGLALDRDGLVYVSDATFCNVQVFQPDGALLLALGSRADARAQAQDAPGRYLLPAKLATDASDAASVRLYVVDQYLHKIEVLRRLSDAEGRRLQAGAPA